MIKTYLVNFILISKIWIDLLGSLCESELDCFNYTMISKCNTFNVTTLYIFPL